MTTDTSGHELALAQAEAMIERQADELARLRDENANLRDEIEECDALRSKLADILARTANALKGEPAPLHLHSWHDLPECARRLRADAGRLNWLDAVNLGTNERNETVYGWKFDINHNRAALTDHNSPALSVRAAIDAAMQKGE